MSAFCNSRYCQYPADDLESFIQVKDSQEAYKSAFGFTRHHQVEVFTVPLSLKTDHFGFVLP